MTRAAIALIAAALAAGCTDIRMQPGAAAAGAGVVKITPLGSHDGEFCVLDRALVLEDPNGTRILYDAGFTVRGADDALTVKTDKGEFILDNQAEEILLWSDVGYRFVKRQSQVDPNLWVSLGDARPAPATATSR